jgi:hypothetical protein
LIEFVEPDVAIIHVTEKSDLLRPCRRTPCAMRWRRSMGMLVQSFHAPCPALEI